MNESSQRVASLPQMGDRFRCPECGMEVELVSPCRCELGHPHFICCGRPLVSAGRSFAAETKDAFVDQIETAIERTKETAARLRKKANEARDASKEEASREVDGLNKQFDQLRAALQELKNSSGDAWQDLAAGCKDSWRNLRSACEKAASRYRE